jgi:hypothetical protein
MAKQRVKADELTHRSERGRHLDAERARLDAEVRFAKLQQWATATAAITLLGAISHIAHQRPLAEWEQWIVFALIGLVEIGAAYFLHDLQRHLGRTRNLIDPEKHPRRRGTFVLLAFIGIIVVTAVVVAYSV